MTVVGLVFGALLGFTVVVSWEQFSSAEANVAHEASTLTTMYRQTVAMPSPEQAQLREQLHKYAKAAEGPDWEAFDSSGGSDDARTAITEMYRLLGNQPNASSNPVNGNSSASSLSWRTRAISGRWTPNLEYRRCCGPV
ncbi:MAG TPA: hypothetical protein VN959_06780 [Mycobacterium sp.]|nr:hypothetical protein [Mycobacterium sp.]